MAARLIVIVEIVISLRLLPSGCFEVVQWSQVLPHFQGILDLLLST